MEGRLGAVESRENVLIILIKQHKKGGRCYPAAYALFGILDIIRCIDKSISEIISSKGSFSSHTAMAFHLYV